MTSATISLDEFPDSVWRDQARHVPGNGKPNSVLPSESADAKILSFYDDDGCLRGILKYFEKDVPRIDQHGNYLVANAGETLVMVHPDYRKRGVATKLLHRAMELYPINLAKQRYTPSGAAFVTQFLANRAKELT